MITFFVCSCVLVHVCYSLPMTVIGYVGAGFFFTLCVLSMELRSSSLGECAFTYMSSLLPDILFPIYRFTHLLKDKLVCFETGFLCVIVLTVLELRDLPASTS